MATRRYVFKREALTGGVNDTPFPDTRAQNQARTQTNVRSTPELTLEKVKGRLKHATAHDVGDTVTDIMIPPKKTPIITLTSANNAIYCKVGAGVGVGYYTGTLAVGSYYSYSSLATALKAALDTATVTTNWTVTYTAPSGTSSGYFTVTYTGDTWYLCWYHSLTTLPASTFGYQWTITAATGVGIAGTKELEFNKSGEYACRGGDTRYYSRASDKLYDEAKAEVKYDDETSMSFGANRIAGVWHNNKYYFSDGANNWTMRHWTPRLALANGEPRIRAALNNGGSSVQANLYLYTTAHAAVGITINNTNRCARLPISARWTGAAWATTADTNVVADYISLWLRSDVTGAILPDFDLNIYYECFWGATPVPDGSLYYRKTLLKTYHRSELPASSTYATGAEVSFSCNCFMEADLGGSDLIKRNLLLEFAPRTVTDGAVNIYGTTGLHADTRLSYYLSPISATNDASWINTTVPNQWAWYGVVRATAVVGSVAIWKIKVALENDDGYITELSDAYNFTNSAGCLALLVTRLADVSELLWPGRYDVKNIVFYRTIEGGDTFYEWFRVPCEFWNLSFISQYDNHANLGIVNNASNVNFVGITDAVLLTQAPADVDTSRTAELPFDKCVLWDNRLFVNQANSDVLYWSEVNQPENFNLAEYWIRIGTDGSPIKGIAPCGDRLVVFKEASFHVVRPSGTSYAVDSVNDDGIGTLSHWSLVSDFGKGGAVVFFQGNDSRFYVTDGVNLTPLSGGSDEWPGRLEEFCKSSESYTGLYQNKAALAATMAFLNVPDKEVVWSVCTGSNTTPDKNVVFSQTSKGFYFEDTAAYIWKSDHLTTGTIRYIGARYGRIT